MFDFSAMGSNPFFSGGLLLMVLGGAIMALRSLPGQIYDFIERFFILKIEILDEDEAYAWMQIWLTEKLKNTLSISVITKRSNVNQQDEEPTFRDNKPQIYFVPAVGTYFFWYKRRFVTLYRDRKENAASNVPLLGSDGKSTMRTKESFTLRIFSSNKKLARELIEECRHMALPEDGKIDIRVANYSYWLLGTRIKPRPLDSVILDGSQATDILEDIKDFRNSYDWYQNVGVPWRRNYLLYGPPGCGKSSAVKAFAGELGMHIYLLMLSDPDMNDNRINELLGKVADNSIVLLEDIDCAFSGEVEEDKRKKKGRESGLTFSGLLNAMDGVASPEGRIIFMTTNHIEKLDPALIRPGRADVRLLIDNATPDQAKRLYARFFPRYERYATEFGKLIPSRKFSMATLQDYLMLHRQYPIKALEMANEIGEMQVKSVKMYPEQKVGF